jgi:hypothetical protein
MEINKRTSQNSQRVVELKKKKKKKKLIIGRSEFVRKRMGDNERRREDVKRRR